MIHRSLLIPGGLHTAGRELVPIVDKFSLATHASAGTELVMDKRAMSVTADIHINVLGECDW